MRTFLTINIILLLFSACSYDNAFSRFDISPQRAKSEENIQSAKIYDANNTVGIVSGVYLNPINPKKYKDGEYFYIYLYVKNMQEVARFTLNDTNATSTDELEVNNDFTVLTDSKVPWQKYYLVRFEQQDTNLSLISKVANFASSVMVFTKDN